MSDAKEIALGLSVRPRARAPWIAAAVGLAILVAAGIGWTLASPTDASSVITSAAPPAGSSPAASGGEATRTDTAPNPGAVGARTADPTLERVEGASQEGASPEGASPEGASPESASQEGASQEGASPEGASPESASQEGTQEDGTERPRRVGRLNLMAIPPAEVFLGSHSLGRTPLVGVPLAPGRYRLTLRPAGGGPPHTTTVTIRAGERTLESVRL